MAICTFIVFMAISNKYLLWSFDILFYVFEIMYDIPEDRIITYSYGWGIVERIGDYFTAIAPFTIASYLLFIVCYFARFSHEDQSEP